jgi:hypothetical protein
MKGTTTGIELVHVVDLMEGFEENEWLTDDDSDGVKVVQKIVGNTVGVHTSCQGVGSSTKTTIVDIKDGLEKEDTAGLEGAANIVDELVVVTVVPSGACSPTNARLANVPETLPTNASKTTMGKDVAKNVENIAKIRATWRLLDQTIVQIP